MQFLCQQKYGEKCGTGLFGALDASVQYPFVTGGVMVFTALVSTIRCKKIRKIECLSTVIAFVASVMIAI